jgi:hypothetical protein
MLSAEVPKLPALMDEAEADVFAFMSFPKDHRDAAFARADRGDDPVAGKRQQIVEFAEQSKAVPARADGHSYRGGGIRALQPRKMKSEQDPPVL